MSKPCEAAKQAADKIIDCGAATWPSRVLTPNLREYQSSTYTPIIQAAIDEATAERQARIKKLEDRLREVCRNYLALTKPGFDVAEAALAPAEKGGDANARD